MLKNKSYAALKRKLDAVFSEWVRRRVSVNGVAKCCSCGVVRPWKELQCGHFVTRARLATRFLPENCAPQCVKCNIFMSGNAVGYARYLENRYGPSIFADLDERSKKPVKYRRGDLQAMIDEFTEKLKRLETA